MSVVNEIGKLEFTGNIIPNSWFKEITHNGKADLIAIQVLSEIVYWYRPNDKGRKKFDSDKLSKSYGTLAKKFNLSKAQISDAVKRLKQNEFINTELRHFSVNLSNGSIMGLGNVLFIEPIPENVARITYTEEKKPAKHQYAPRKTQKSYKEQLNSPEWQRKRLEAMEAAEWQCEQCECKTSQLHVHHKEYKNGRMAWEYSLSELVVLCEQCHAKIHGKEVPV